MDFIYLGTIFSFILVVLLWTIFKYGFKNLYLNCVELYSQDVWKMSDKAQFLAICAMFAFLFSFVWIPTLYSQISNCILVEHSYKGDIVSFEKPNTLTRQKLGISCKISLINNNDTKNLNVASSRICKGLGDVFDKNVDKCVKIFIAGDGSEYRLDTCDAKNLVYVLRASYSHKYIFSLISFAVFILITLILKKLKTGVCNE